MVNSKFTQRRSSNWWMMSMMIQAILVLCLLTGSQATDYCDANLCDPGEQHIGCGNDGSWGDNCPPDAALLDIDEAAQQDLIEAHNEVRQEWASGNGLLPVSACRMATIIWNDELAELAELNVKQCIMEHDECHNTDQFKYAGQNLFMAGYSGMGAPDVPTLLRKAVHDWAGESEFITEEYLAEYPENYNGPTIGHFTAVVQERSIAVGCAMSSYEQNNFNMFIVACNYAATNIFGRPVYKACDEPAEECTSGTNPDYPALCSTDEDIDYNFEH